MSKLSEDAAPPRKLSFRSGGERTQNKERRWHDRLYNFSRPVFSGSEERPKLPDISSRDVDKGCNVFVCHAIGALLVFLFAGLVCDFVVWGEVNQYYTRIMPLFGLLLALLLSVSKCVSNAFKHDPEKEERMLERFYLLIVTAQFIALHFYIIAASETGVQTNDEFFTNKQFEALLVDASFRTEDATREVKTLLEIDSHGEFFTWMRGPLLDNFACEEPTNNIPPFTTSSRGCRINDGKYLMAEPIKLRQIMSKPRGCVYNRSIVCTSDYTPETEFKETLVLPLNISKCSNGSKVFFSLDGKPDPLLKQKVTRENGLRMEWKDGTYLAYNSRRHPSPHSSGRVASYHKGGYTVFLHLELASKEEQAACISHFEELGMLSRFTRALFLEVAIAVEDINSYHLAQVQLEFLACGKVETRIFQQHSRIPGNPSDFLPGYPQGRMGTCEPDHFNPVFDPSCVPQPYAPPELPLLLLILLVFNGFMMIRVSQLWWQHGAYYVFGDFYRFDILNSFLLLLSFIFVLLAQASTPQRLTDAHEAVFYIETLKVTLAFLALGSWIRITEVLAFQRGTKLVMVTLFRGSNEVVGFSIILFAVLAGFAINFHLLFGKTSPDYNDPLTSIFSVILGLSGGLNTEGIYLRSPLLTLFTHALFIVFVVFTLLTILIAILSFDAAKVEAERILHEETEEEHQPELIRRWLDENEHNLVVVQWSPDRKTLYLQAT